MVLSLLTLILGYSWGALKSDGDQEYVVRTFSHTDHHIHRHRHGHLPGGWRRSNDALSPGDYIIEDDSGRQHAYWFTSFPEPLTFGITVAEGDPERTLLLLPRMEALAKTHHIADESSPGQRPRLFGMRWESDDGTNVTTAVGVVVNDDARSPSPLDMFIYRGRSGPYVMMHRYGPHIEIDQVYGLVYGKIFPRHGLQNRTRSDAWKGEEEVTDFDGDDEQKQLATTHAERVEDETEADVPSPPLDDPILEEYGMVPSTAVAWSFNLVTVCYIPIADTPPDVVMSYPTTHKHHTLIDKDDIYYLTHI